MAAAGHADDGPASAWNPAHQQASPTRFCHSLLPLLPAGQPECLNLASFSRHQHHTHLGLDFGRFWAPRPQAAKGTGRAAKQTAQACAGAERRPDGAV